MSMIEDEAPLPAPRDHNRPPSLVETIVEDQAEALLTFAQRRDELVTAAKAKEVFDRISAGDATDIIRIASEVYKRIDQERRDRTDPLRRAADAAKGKVDEFWQPVVDAMDALRVRLKQWTDAEDALIEQQKAEQEAAMNRMREAAMSTTRQPSPASPAGQPLTAPAGRPIPADPAPIFKPAARRRIRGDLGATLATVERAQYRVVDIKQVPDWILSTPTVHDAIISVVKSLAKHTGDIPGIERTVITDNQIR
jgi:hypothetical protein